MKRTKKLLLMFVALFAFSTVSYAVEVSLGASASLGVPFLSGKDAKKFTSSFETFTGDDNPFRVSYMPSIDLMIEVLPFLAIETGVDLDVRVMEWEASAKENVLASSVGLARVVVSIPLMLRGQYEYKIGVTYVSVGVKFGIPIVDSPTTVSTLFAQKMYKSSDFAMDVSFAVGQEFRVGVANYLGLRVGYDLDVVSSLDKKPFTDIGQEIPSLFIDNLNFAITYRYAFNSKWKK